MNIKPSYVGSSRPFERERRLDLRCIPEGASIRSAVATVTPRSTDAGNQFLETISLNGSESWGATKRIGGNPATTSSIEVDLHARRKLAGADGTGLEDATLLVDLGGGFIAVDEHGGLSGDPPFKLNEGSNNLPGLTVTGLRVQHATPLDVSAVRVLSPPANLTMALAGGPTFWNHFGDLVTPITTPDFAPLLQEAVDQATVEHGYTLLGFDLHSDSIARLDITLDVEFLIAVSATPEGLEQVSLQYEFGSTPQGGASPLSVSIPRGSVAAPGATTGRVQGAFEASRVVFGPTGRVETTGQATIEPATSHAQPFTPDGTTLATSVDVFVAAVTATTEIAIDVVGDLDGKPDRVSLLGTVPSRTVSRDDAPDLTWVNIALPSELELAGGRRYWMVVHARQGSLAWGRKASTDTPSLQSTSNGGLSWRLANDTASAAQFRLRHTASSFTMPIDLRIAVEGADEVVVDLDRFTAAGQLDFDLGFPEVTGAINAALDAAGANAVPLGEHLGNGDFVNWFGIGHQLTGAGTIEPPGAFNPVIPAFSPDGNTLYLASSNNETCRFEAYETYCRARLLAVELPLRVPSAVLVNQAGTRALVSTADTEDDESSELGVSFSSMLSLIDLDGKRLVGSPIDVPPGLVTDLAAVPDGSGVYIVLVESQGSRVARIDWVDLEQVAIGALQSGSVQSGSETSGSTPFERSRPIEGFATAVTVGPDGTVLVTSFTIPDGNGPSVTEAVGPPAGHINPFPADLSLPSRSPVPTVRFPLDAAITGSGHHLVVMGATHVAVLDATTLAPIGSQPLPTGAGRLAPYPFDESVFMSADGPVLRLDTSTRKLESTDFSITDGLGIAISPLGNRAVVTAMSSPSAQMLKVGEDLAADWELTAGRISPTCFGDPAEPVALLGQPANPKRQEVRPAALSQVVPVVADTPYRFAFEAMATIDGATAEVLWRTEDCGADRIDVIEIDSLEQRPGPGPVDALTVHEGRFISPPGAVAAEIRFQTPDDCIELDRVSLTGSTEAVANAGLNGPGGTPAGWDNHNPQVSIGSGTAGRTTIGNGSIVEGRMSQLVAVTGTVFELNATARLTAGAGAEVTVEFLTATGAPVGDPVRLPIEPLAFDCLAAHGDVPDGADDATLSIVLPPSATVEIENLSLQFQQPIPVSLGFVSQAPGRLLVSDVFVGTDVATPSRPPVPDTGLCPATPPGSEPGHDTGCCHCSVCGEDTPIRRPTPVFSPNGRPNQLSTCEACGELRLSIGGRSVADAGPPPLRSFSIREPDRGPVAVVAGLAVPQGLEAVSGISQARAASLRRLQIRTMADLAGADVEVVSSIRGISTAMAEGFIRQARAVVERDGRRVMVEPDGEPPSRAPTVVDPRRLLVRVVDGSGPAVDRQP